jgi:hypothetical protein
MRSLHSFNALIADALGAEAPAQTPSKDEVLLRLGDRDLFVGLDSKREEVTVSTVIFMADDLIYRFNPELAAEFNATHLLAGGYRLAYEPASRCAYVCARISLARLVETGLVAFCQEFIDRCVTCSRWLQDESEAHVARVAAHIFAQTPIEQLTAMLAGEG